jgi:hypothetical protein
LRHERSEALVETGGNADAKLNSVHRETPKILSNLADDKQYLTRVPVVTHTLKSVRASLKHFLSDFIKK